MVENNKQGPYIKGGGVAFDFSYVGLKTECDCQLCERFTRKILNYYFIMILFSYLYRGFREYDAVLRKFRLL